MTLQDHITRNLFIAPDEVPPTPSEADLELWTDDEVYDELDWTWTTTLERSRRHGLSDVGVAIGALPLRQRLAHLLTLQAYIGAANHARMERGEDPNANVDLEQDYLAAHPLPPAAEAEWAAIVKEYRTHRE